MLRSHNKTIFEILGRNPIHPFPARMAPGIALEAVGESRKPLRVLDPMTGSGTVLAVARANGHRAFGFDLDPLAVLIAGVWTRAVEADQVNEKAKEVLSRAKHRFGSLTCGHAYPIGSDKETRKFIRFWFDDYARRQLAALSLSIQRVHNQAVREALWCGFSRLIIAKSAGASLAMDLSHSRPHRKFLRAPIKPFARFISAVETIVSNCPQRGQAAIGPATVVKRGDARSLDMGAESIDLVLSSPPYLNAIDYIRCSKFSLVWMGYTVDELREIRSSSIGAESCNEEALSTDWVQSLIAQLGFRGRLSNRDKAILSRYIWDMGQALAEVSRVLRRNGRAIYVVGDSKVRGTFVRNSKIVEAVAEEHGLKFHSRHSRVLPQNRRYLPPPKQNSDHSLDARISREVVLVFNKPAA